MKTTHNTILLPGGNSGIGRGLAEAFAALGNRVIIGGRNPQTLDETTSANPGMKSLQVNMADAQSVAAFAREAMEKYPDINVLINMAGIMSEEKLAEEQGDIADAEAMIATNLLGPLRLTSLFLPFLQTKPNAVVMNVSSGLAYVPLALNPTYCATKAAIHSYTESLRYQLKDTPVEVLELVPPYVATRLQGERQASDPNAMPLDEYIAEVMELLKSDPTPTEICVQRVLPQRNAAFGGKEKYDGFFQKFNDTMTAARAGK